MKTISSALRDHLGEDITTLATCWKITRTDAVILGFTSHDTDLVIDSVTYNATSAFSSSDITSGSDLSEDGMQVVGVLSSDAITEADILAGKYDFAEVETFLVNYADLTQGKLTVRTGWLGEVTSGKARFEAELSGLTQRLNRTIGQLYSPSCRVTFGDNKCGVNLASHTVTGTITDTTSNRLFTDSSRMEAAGYFSFGMITFTSGANNGLSMEVKQFAGGQIELVLPMPYGVSVGDSYSMVAGCDKTFETCKNSFSNAVNFRGEPHLPGTDKILKTAATRV